MPKIIDETNNRYGRLLVLKLDETTNIPGKNKKWICKCDCGKEVSVLGTSLRSGNTKSCGCLHKEQLANRNANNSTVKVGNKYGKLTIIKDLGMRKQQSRNKNERWSLCQCDCGNQIEIPNNMLQNGWKKSCGCLSSSYGEFLIKQVLEKNNINYSEQYKFNDLFYKNKTDKLRFDFAIFKNNILAYLIEFDGRQHFIDENNWDNLKDNFQDRKIRDEIKNQYCLKNNIPLIRIPYTEYKNISLEILIPETSPFLLGKENNINE